MSRPRVSVCIPVYNLERYVAETLDSLKAQTYQDYEAIIVNDGSTDASESVIAPYLDDPRFKYISQQNGGVAQARRTAVEAAQGEWFACLDGDDLWMPDKLEQQIALIDSDSRTNLVYGNVMVFEESGCERIFYSSESMMPEGDIIRSIYTNNFVATSSVMVKTADIEAVGGYPILRYGEDYTLWLRLARKGIWAKVCKKPVVRYRIRGNSQVCDQLSNRVAQAEIMTEALSHEDRPRFARILRKGIAANKREEAYERARVAARDGDGDVEQLLWKASALDRPGRKRLCMAIMCTLSRLTHISGGRARVLRMLQTRTERETTEQSAVN